MPPIKPKPSAPRPIIGTSLAKPLVKTTPLPKKLKNDEFSTGMGRALRASSALGTSRTTLVQSDPAVTAATTRVNKALTSGGPKAAAIQLEKEIAAAPPEQRKAIYDANLPSIDQALAKFGPLSKKDSTQVIVSLGHAAELAGPEAVQDFATRAAKAIAEQGVGDFDDGFKNLVTAGVSPEVALATAAELRKLGKTDAATSIENAVFHGIEQLTGDVKKYADQKAELEARLAQDMAQFGGTMTPAERQRYQEEFWKLPEHAEVKAKAEQLSQRLSEAVTDAGPAMEAAAISGNELAGEKLLDAHEQLARFPEYAEQAITWVKELGANEALFEKIDGFTNGSLETRLSDGLMTDATTSVQTQLLAQYGDSPDGKKLLLAKMKELYGDFKLAKSLPKLAKDIASFLDDTERFANGSPQRLEQIASSFAEKSKFGKAAAIFSIAAGLYGTGKELSDGHYLEALKKGLGASASGLELTAGLLNAYSNAAGASGDAAKFLGKFAPALGMVLDAIQLGEDINELRNDPNAGEIVKAVGTLLQLGGDVAGYVPIAGTLVDGILTIGGSLIHAIGGFIDGIIEGNDKRDKLRGEQAELLAKATGISPDQAMELVKTPVATMQRLSAMGFGPKEIRALATNPKVDLDSTEFQYALKTAALFGLSPQDTKTFLDMTLDRGEFGYAGTPLTQVAIPLDQPRGGDWSLTYTPEGQQEYLRAVQEDLLAGLPNHEDLVKFLETHRGTPDWETVKIYASFDM
ncbi:MAG: hypothetical protein Q8L14_32595 [Myxococcales bacterium]|nr:hypothetical protein [Myxococcales bacterium]